MATVRKRGNTYQIRVSVGYDSTGRHLEKTMTWKPSPGMTERQIKKELDRQTVLFEEKVKTGQFLDGNITLDAFINKWLDDYAEKQLKEQTLQGYKELMPRILTALGHIRLSRLQPHHLIEFYNNLSEHGIRKDLKYKSIPGFQEYVKQTGYTQQKLAEAAGVSLCTVKQCIKGGNIAKSTVDKITAVLSNPALFEPVNDCGTLSDSTVIKYHRLLSSILTTAVQWQVIPSNPCSRVKPPHTEYKEAPVLDKEDVKRLIQCLDDEPLKYKTAVMLILYTGMRRGELCGLNWDDIDLNNGIIHITKTLLYTPSKGLYEDTPKTRQSDRAVNIPDDMIELLKAYRSEQEENRCLCGDLWQNNNKVFKTDFGGVMRPDTLTAWFKKFIRRHNLPDAHIHTLRHVSATLLIASGVDLATISGRLGHANKSTTLNIYTHAIKSADALAAEKLKNMLN